MLNPMPDWNASYYGREVTARDIVLSMSAHNPGADPLRAALMRFGAQASPAPAAAAPMPVASPAVASAAPRGSVGRTTLPPPPR